MGTGKMTLKKYFEIKEWPLTMVSRAVMINPSRLSLYVSGKAMISVEDSEKLAKFLKIQPNTVRLLNFYSGKEAAEKEAAGKEAA